MSAKLIKYILVITNLILILLPIAGIVFSYFFLKPKIVDEYDLKLGLYTLAFSSWGTILILSSICFIGIVFTSVICLHLIAALFLCCPLALCIWIVVEQFLYKSDDEKPNIVIIVICVIASFIWVIQIFCELILACYICCSPNTENTQSAAEIDEKNTQQDDAEKGIEEKMSAVKIKSTGNEKGTDEEKAKLVTNVHESNQLMREGGGGMLVEHEESKVTMMLTSSTTTDGEERQHTPVTDGATLEEEEEAEEEGDEEDEEEEEEEEVQRTQQDDENVMNPQMTLIDEIEIGTQQQLLLQQQQQVSMTRDHEIGNLHDMISQPTDLPLHTIPEEKHNLQSVQCPLATPEDTGV